MAPKEPKTARRRLETQGVRRLSQGGELIGPDVRRPGVVLQEELIGLAALESNEILLRKSSAVIDSSSIFQENP